MIVYYGRYNGKHQSDESHWEVGTELGHLIKRHICKEKKKRVIQRGHRLLKREVLEELLVALRYYVVIKRCSGLFTFRNCNYSILDSDAQHGITQIPLLLKASNNTMKVRF